MVDKTPFFKYVLIGVILIVAAILLWGWLGPAPAEPADTTVTPSGYQPTCDVGDTGTIKLSTLNFYNQSTAAPPDVNAELWDGVLGSNPTQIQAEAQIDAAGDTLSSAVPQFLGDVFIPIGNDNYVSGTDRGDEYYYRMYKKTLTECISTLSYDDLMVHAEGTPTWTAYDDGTAETTANITIGSGETYTDLELKMKAPAKKCLGNPEFNGKKVLAVCFNASVETDFDSIKPESKNILNGEDVNGFAAPEFLNGMGVIDDVCFVLNTKAVCDSDSYTFGTRIKAESATDPGGSAEIVNAILIDWTYFRNDAGKWDEGWEDKSSTVADTDIGIDGKGNGKVIYIT